MLKEMPGHLCLKSGKNKINVTVVKFDPTLCIEERGDSTVSFRLTFQNLQSFSSGTLVSQLIGHAACSLLSVIYSQQIGLNFFASKTLHKSLLLHGQVCFNQFILLCRQYISNVGEEERYNIKELITAKNSVVPYMTEQDILEVLPQLYCVLCASCSNGAMQLHYNARLIIKKKVRWKWKTKGGKEVKRKKEKKIKRNVSLS